MGNDPMHATDPNRLADGRLVPGHTMNAPASDRLARTTELIRADIGPAPMASSNDLVAFVTTQAAPGEGAGASQRAAFQLSRTEPKSATPGDVTPSPGERQP
jgi:hypothetical protein